MQTTIFTVDDGNVEFSGSAAPPWAAPDQFGQAAAELHRSPNAVSTLYSIPAGCTVMVLPSGANRDPREFEQPDELRLDRENARQHIAFGHGIHTCAGAPLARAESNVSLQRLLDRMADIRISEAHHGAAGDRHWEYTPTWMLRGHDRLHLEFTPAD